MSIEAMRQARNAFVWNLNTDLDNIPACDKWAKMLRSNIDNLDKAIEATEQRKPWVGLTDEEIKAVRVSCGNPLAIHLEFARAIEAKIKELNT